MAKQMVKRHKKAARHERAAQHTKTTREKKRVRAKKSVETAPGAYTEPLTGTVEVMEIEVVSRPDDPLQADEVELSLVPEDSVLLDDEE